MIAEDAFQVDIFRRPENVDIDIRLGFPPFRDPTFDFFAFGVLYPIGNSASAFQWFNMAIANVS